MLINKINFDEIAKLPGVYKMIDIENNIIYIGKAKNLFNRLKSYTQKNLDIKTEKMVSNINRVETIVTKTEFEAILLELFLIKKHKPKYNIIEKDNKSNCYIEIEKKPDFPATRISRIPKNDSFLIGPFLKKQQALKIIQTIRPIFKTRDCSDQFFKSRKRPCIEYEIGRCSAPCVGLISKENYKEDVNKLKAVFESEKIKTIEKEIKKKMEFFIDQEDFQRAKDENEKMKLLSNLKNTKDFKNIDFVSIVNNDDFFVVLIAVFRYGIKIENHQQVFEKSKFFDQFYDFLENFYKNRDIPEKIVVNKSREFLSFPQNQQT